MKNSLKGLMVHAPTLVGYDSGELLEEYVGRAVQGALPMIMTDHSGESGGYRLDNPHALYSILFGR